MPVYNKLTSILRQQGLDKQAAQYERRGIDAADKERLPLAEYAKNCISWARYEIGPSSGRQHLDTAERYLNLVIDSPTALPVSDLSNALTLLTTLTAGAGRGKEVTKRIESSAVGDRLRG